MWAYPVGALVTRDDEYREQISAWKESRSHYRRVLKRVNDALKKCS